jgi:hypothetical protein
MFTDANKAHQPRARIDTRDRERGTTRRRQSAMDRLDQRDTFFIDIVGKCPRCGFGGVGRVRPVAGAIHQQQGDPHRPCSTAHRSPQRLSPG